MNEAERQGYYEKSMQAQLCQELFEISLDFYDVRQVVLEGFQEKSLLNHIAEMVKRDYQREKLSIDDKNVFEHVPEAAMNKAKEIVGKLKFVSEDEVYLLSTHFAMALL